MKASDAIRMLEEVGYTGHNGRGSHYIMRRGHRTIVISKGREELSSGMTAKVRSHVNYARKNLPKEKLL